MNSQYFIQPNWPAPPHVHAYTSLRQSDISRPPDVRLDRERLIQLLNLPSEPIWLKQTHSNIVIPATPDHREQEADASFSTGSKQVCLIQTADCLPILMCNRAGTQVAAIHAGWRGLEKHIIAETVSAMKIDPAEWLAWIGPGISQPHFEVGSEVRDLFLSQDPITESAFIPSPNNRWLADLYAIASLQLKNAGILSIHQTNHCTYAEPQSFFSYRRDGAGTGRMVSVIWTN